MQVTVRAVRQHQLTGRSGLTMALTKTKTTQPKDMKMQGPKSFKFEHATKDALNEFHPHWGFQQEGRKSKLQLLRPGVIRSSSISNSSGSVQWLCSWRLVPNVGGCGSACAQ